MKLFWRGFCLLTIVVFIWSGLRLARTVWLANTPASAFSEVPGKVIEVIRHVVSVGDGSTNEHLAEVKFSYTYAANNYVANTFSPLCTQCTPEEVLNTIGERPSQISSGKRVRVFVNNNDPKIAYLSLPSSRQLVEQSLFALLFLLIGPAFAYWGFWQIGKPSIFKRHLPNPLHSAKAPQKPACIYKSTVIQLTPTLRAKR